MHRTQFLKQAHEMLYQFCTQLPISNWCLFYLRMMETSKRHDYKKVKCPSLFFIYLFLYNIYNIYIIYNIYKTYIYILVPSPWSHIWFASTSPSSVGCLFTFLMVFLEALTCFILMKFGLYIFVVDWAFGVLSKKLLPNPRSERLLLCFFPEGLCF